MLVQVTETAEALGALRADVGDQCIGTGAGVGSHQVVDGAAATRRCEG